MDRQADIAKKILIAVIVIVVVSAGWMLSGYKNILKPTQEIPQEVYPTGEHFTFEQCDQTQEQPQRGYCFMILAKETNSSVYCKEALQPLQCYVNYVLTTGDDSVCASLPENVNGTNQREVCMQRGIIK